MTHLIGVIVIMSVLSLAISNDINKALALLYWQRSIITKYLIRYKLEVVIQFSRKMS